MNGEHHSLDCKHKQMVSKWLHLAISVFDQWNSMVLPAESVLTDYYPLIPFLISICFKQFGSL